VRVALATCRALPRLVEDDRLLQRALESRGVRAEPAVWDDAAVGWTELDAVVVRSCWDYHLQPEAFDAWIRRLEKDGVSLWNPPEVLRWNARKTYLRDLEAAGISIVPTRFIEQSDTGLEAVLDETGWDEVVVKPVVSASAYGTWRTSRATLARDLENDRRLRGSGEVLVQPFLPGIQADGEWSLCFFDDRFSHAVLKRPRPGDFRVQSDHGGIHLPAEPPAEVLACAKAALRAAGRRTVYARVDGCVVDDTFRLMELELLEPGLFLSTNPAAPDRLAEAVIRAAGHE
jgi:glutathione synthase/RimK-type ligase-like ATP-grasp enzyme